MLKKNEKGFNLFTALVSFILIVLSVLLINSMIQSQRSTTNRISQEKSMSELQAVADMARADAVQVFNYGLRKAIEDWMTDPDIGGATLNISNKSWEEIKKGFAKAKFGDEKGVQFAQFTAGSLTALFYTESHFGNYAVKLELDSDQSFESTLAKLTAESAKQDNFFEIVECPKGDPKDCPKGTFYVNLAVAKLSQEEYEKLPRLKVTNKSTKDEIKEIILPRTNLRIYVPLRIFKAMAEARALSHFPLSNGEIPTNGEDEGLFSPKIHNQIEEMALGMCDEGYCSPRGDPFVPPASTSISGVCPGDSKTADNTVMVMAVMAVDQTTSFSRQYNASNTSEMESTIEEMARQKICNIVANAKAGDWIDFGPNDGFTIEPGSYCTYLQELQVNAGSHKSKVILRGLCPASGCGSGAPGGRDPGSASYNPTSCNRTPKEYRQIGLYMGDQGIMVPDISPNDPEFSCELGVLPDNTNPGSYGDHSEAKCSEVQNISLTLWFKETNTAYMVDKQSSPYRIYRMTLLDNGFVPFTARRGNQGSIGSNCTYSLAPSKTDCKFSQGWTCITSPNNPLPTDTISCSPYSSAT